MANPGRFFWVRRRPDFPADANTLRAAPAAGLVSPLPVRERFFRFYDELRNLLEGHANGPGLALAALDEDGVEAQAFLPAERTSLATAVVGRHAKAEIHLGGDPTLSLRHLLIVLSAVGPGGSIRFRVLDLRTPMGFCRESGAQVRALEGEGAAAIGCGRYVLVLFGREEGRARSLGPDEAWNELNWFEPVARTEPDPFEGPLLDSDETPRGELVVSSEQGESSLPVGRRALRAGVLFGRAQRCEAMHLLMRPDISRVHVIVIELDDALYAIDAASKNGVWTPGGIERVYRLEEGSWVSLAGSARVGFRSI